MRIDVLDVDDQSTAREDLGGGRGQTMIDGSAVQPGDLLRCADLTVDDAAV